MQINNTLYWCQYVYKYAAQDLHRKQVHVNSVPRHCVPPEISTAMRDGTESRSMFRQLLTLQSIVGDNIRFQE